MFHLVSFVLCLTAENAVVPNTGAEAKSTPNANLDAAIDEVATRRFLHGFRFGYLYLFGVDAPIENSEGAKETLRERFGVRSPHQFLLGYEVMWRVFGHDWLNVLLVANAMVAGLEQSKFFPSTNGLIGFEIAEQLQLGLGINASPTSLKPVHMVLAAGWTPRVGDLHIPVHAFFVPDVDDQHRVGLTVGVNW